MWKVQNDSIPTRVVNSNTNSLRKVFMFILTYDVGQKSLEDDRCALAMQPRIVILIVRPLPLARNQAAGQPG